MSKKYLSELLQINSTYQWANQVNIDELVAFVSLSRNSPLISVGSGGSLTVAHLAALLHQNTGALAKAATPFDVSANLRSTLRSSNVIIASASGRNKDILSAFRIAVDTGVKNILALCMQLGSPLGELSTSFRHTLLAQYSPPFGKDGFLATNSLIASAVLLIRAYNTAGSEKLDLPSALPVIEETQLYLDDSRPDELLAKQTLVILFGGWSVLSAIDLESKCTEAGLVHVQTADFRNFGHGRHHWLAKNPATSGVIALYSPSEEDLARKTLKQLPSNIPQMHLKSSYEGASGSLQLLAHGLNLVHFLGQVRNIDPGQPRVPEFGRKLYHLSYSYKNTNATSHKLPQCEIDAIIRKAGIQKIDELSNDAIQYWRKAYQRYIQRLTVAEFSGIVLDYDGTLCDLNERYSGMPSEVAILICNLLRFGIHIGIATGRGVSVRKDLQAKIPPELWSRVLVGYYNGGDIGRLSENNHPDISIPTNELLQQFWVLLNANPEYSSFTQHRLRPNQLSIEVAELAHSNRIRTMVIDIFNKAKLTGLQLFDSGHSIDIVAPGISKKNLISSLEKDIKHEQKLGSILCIGDRGEWPGNDFELLSTTYSLSVDNVSPDPDSCWNINIFARRGVRGTIEYLSALQFEKLSLRFEIDRIMKGNKLAR
jgi:fructoselysine-6-P-deglycase FrlB-like protein/hydroxymethylpyrimidine pyrophosphatase-like HAD family hydrolase